MSRPRAPLWQRGGSSSFLVRSSSSVAASTSSKRINSNSTEEVGGRRRRRRSASVMPLDMIGQEVGDDNGVNSSSTPVTCAGVFVTSNTVLAALTTSEWLRSSQEHPKSSSLLSSSGTSLLGVVVTAEVGGWLRVRDQRNGAIRYQRRLLSVSDPSCMCWVVGPSPSSSCHTFFVGQHCGLVTMMQLVGETINHVADCVLHEAPIAAMTCVLLCDKAGVSGSSNDSHHASMQEVLVTLDTSGLLAVWDTTNLICLHTMQLRNRLSARCLASGRSVPGCVFIPSRVSSASPTVSPSILDDDDSPHIAFDVVLARCTAGTTSSWEEEMTYGGAETAIISMALVSRGGCSSGAMHSTLWGGTVGGALHMWDVSSGASLRVVQEATLSRSPVHHILCAPHCVDPGYVWVSTRGGTLALWDANRLLLLSELPLSYPKGPPVEGDDAKRCNHRGRGSRTGATAGAHSLRHLVDDLSEAPNHFTLFVEPIEPVLTLRLWSAATDGTVRSWLCHTSLSDIPAIHRPWAAAASASSASFPSPHFCGVVDSGGGGGGGGHKVEVIDKCEVRRFLEEKAKMFVNETSALRGQVSQLSGEVTALEARNRILADALKAAIARIDAESNEGEEEGEEEEDDDNNDGGTLKNTAIPPADSPPPREPPLLQVGATEEAARVDSMRATLQELHGRLQDAFLDKERLLADRMALRLQLSENASKLDMMRELRSAASLPALSRDEAVPEHESHEVQLLREQLSHSRTEGFMYMQRWQEEQARRATAEEELEACRKRLVELEEELRCTEAVGSLMPPAAASASSEGGGHRQGSEKVKGGCVGERHCVLHETSDNVGRELNETPEMPVCHCASPSPAGVGALSGTSDRDTGADETSLVQEGQQRLAAAVAAVLRHMQGTWTQIKRSHGMVAGKVASVHRMQHQLLEKEATLIVHAERLRALEEELRHEERRLMRRRHAERLDGEETK